MNVVVPTRSLELGVIKQGRDNNVRSKYFSSYECFLLEQLTRLLPLQAVTKRSFASLIIRYGMFGRGHYTSPFLRIFTYVQLALRSLRLSVPGIDFMYR